MKWLLKRQTFYAKALISFGVISLLLMRMDISALKELIGHIHVEYWLAAIFLMFVQILALALRWSLLINVHGHKMNFDDSLRITLASLLANYLFITSISGIIIRVALAIKHGISWVQSIAATTLDRLMTLTALLILTVVFLPVLFGIVEKEVYQSTLAAVFTLLLGFGIFSLLFLKNVRRHLIFSHRKIAVGYKYLRSIGRDHNLIAQIIATSLFAQVSYFSAVYIVTISTGTEFPLLYFMAVLPMITIVASLPVGYGGWGIREGAFVYGLGLINIPIETAFIVSVQIGLISMLAVIIASIPALINGNSQFSLKKLRESHVRSKPQDRLYMPQLKIYTPTVLLCVAFLYVAFAVCLQIQVTFFATQDYAGLRLALSDLLLPFAGILILSSLYFKNTSWPRWKKPFGILWPVALAVIMTFSLFNSYRFSGGNPPEI